MADATDIVIKATDRATGPVRNVANAFRGVEAAARAASAAGARFNSAGRAIDANTGRFVKLTGAAESAGGAMSGLSGGLGGLIGGVTLGGLATNAIMGIVGAAKSAAVAVLGLVASFAHGVVEAAAFGERASLAFKLLMHGSGNSEQQLQRVISLAGNLGLNVEDSVKTFQKLLAMQFKPAMAEQLLKMGADLQAIGASSEEVSGALTAISQIKAKGRVQAEELLQLAERGVSTELVITSLGKAMGKTAAEVRKLMEAGKISADQGIAAIGEAIKIKTGEKEFGEAGSKFATTTLSGMTNVFKAKGAAVMLQLGAAIRKPLGEALGPIVKDLMAALDSPEGKAALDGIVGAFNAVFSAVKENWPTVKAFLGGLVDGFTQAAPALKMFAEGMSSAMGVLKIFGVTGATSEQQAAGLGKVLAHLAGLMAFLGGVAVLFIGAFTLIPYVVFRVGSAIGEGIVAIVVWLTGLPARISAFASDLWATAGTLGTNLIDGLVNGITAGAARVIEAVKGVASSAITAAATTLKIGSPSKVFEELGGFAAAGLEIGLERGTGGVVSASAQMASGSAAGAAGGLGGLGGGGPVTVNVPITIDGAGKSAPEIVDELQRTFLANLASAFRQLQAEAGA